MFNLINITVDTDCGFNVWAKVSINGKQYDVELAMDLYTGHVDYATLIDDEGYCRQRDDIKDFINDEINENGLNYYGLGFIGADYKLDIEQNSEDTYMVTFYNPVFVDNGSYNYVYTESFVELTDEQIEFLKHNDIELLKLMKGLLFESISKRDSLKVKEIYAPCHARAITDEELIQLFKDEL